MIFISIILAITIVSMIGYRMIGDRRGSNVLGKSDEKNLKKWMMCLVSVVVLLSSLYVILSGAYDDGTQKWAFGVVGSIMGFWLKPEK
jgi:hypothetical protein